MEGRKGNEGKGKEVKERERGGKSGKGSEGERKGRKEREREFIAKGKKGYMTQSLIILTCLGCPSVSCTPT